MLADDPSVFTADWGEPVSLDGEAVGLGIFVEPFVVDPLGSTGVASSIPRVLLPSEIVPIRDSDDETDPVLELTDRQDAGVTPFRYLVRQRQPDGTGWTSLILAVHPDQF